MRIIAYIISIISSSTFLLYDLHAEENINFKKYLPKTYKKLKNREDIHFLVLGDGITSRPKDLAESNSGGVFFKIFADLLALDNSYRGGVYDLNKSKYPDLSDPFITFENLGVVRNFFIQVWQQLSVKSKSDPDFILIAFGGWDVANSVNPDHIKFYYKSLIDYLRKHNKEIIICSYPLVLKNPHKNSIASQYEYKKNLEMFCKKEKVLFIDFFTASLKKIEFGINNKKNILKEFLNNARDIYYGEDKSKENMDLLGDSFSQDFHKYLGSYIFNGVMGREVGYPINKILNFSSSAKFKNSSTVIESITKLTNQSRHRKKGFVLPLEINNNYIPDLNKVDLSYNLEPGETKDFKLRYNKLKSKLANYKKKSGADLYKQLNLVSNITKFPFLVADNEFYNLINTETAIRPFSVSINSGLFPLIGKNIIIKFLIKNPTNETIKGTYIYTWNDIKNQANITLKPLSDNNININFSLNALDFEELAKIGRLKKNKLKISFKTNRGDVDFNFRVDLIKNLNIDEKYSLYNLSDHFNRNYDIGDKSKASKVSFKVREDYKSLFFDYEINDNLENYKNILIKVFIDGRKKDRVHKKGNVSSLDFLIFPSKKSVSIDFKPKGSFGELYFFPINKKYIKARLEGNKVLITIDKKSLYRHEWGIQTGSRTLGFNTNVFFNNASYSSEEDNEYYLIQTSLSDFDPQGLMTLELSKNKLNNWKYYCY